MAGMNYRQYKASGKRYLLKSEREDKEHKDQESGAPAGTEKTEGTGKDSPAPAGTEADKGKGDSGAVHYSPEQVKVLPERTVLWEDDSPIAPVVTVAMPLWNSRDIVWLPLDSLKHQKDAPPWELTVCEEDHEGRTGPERLKLRENTLRRAGCVRCVYLDAGSGWVPPGLKWHYMGRETSESSMAFLIHDADWYSWPERIKESLEAIQGGADWYDVSRGLFLDIPTGRTVLYHNDRKEDKTDLMIAFRTEYARCVPYNKKERLLNTYLYNVCKDAVKAEGREIVKQSETELKSFMDTCGYNSISKDRITNFDEPLWPYTGTELTLKDLGIPSSVIKRLDKMRGYAGE